MNDGLYDFRTWPQAGRDQLHKCLLKGRETYLERCLKLEAQSKKTPSELSAELQAVRQKLKEFFGEE